MSENLALLAVATDKATYKQTKAHAQGVKEFIFKALYAALGEYHLSHETFEAAEFKAFYRATNLNLTSQDLAIRFAIVDNVVERLAEDDHDVLLAEYTNYATLRAMHLLIEQGLNQEGGQSYSEHINDIRTLTAATSLVVGDDVRAALDQGSIFDLHADNSPAGLSWRLPELNARIGDLLSTDHASFSALPGTGKTSWIADNVTHMAAQLPQDRCVIWFANEEAVKKIRKRIISCAIGKPFDNYASHATMQKQLEEYEAAVNGPMAHRIILVYPEGVPLDVCFAERAMDALPSLYNVSPGLVVFDQLRTMRGFESLGDVQRLLALYQWAREIPKRYDAPVLSVHQLAATRVGGTSLVGKMEGLTMYDLYGSKIEVPGACDLMLAMGAPANPELDYSRCINITKTKELSGKNLDLALGKSPLYTTLIPSIGRFVT